MRVLRALAVVSGLLLILPAAWADRSDKDKKGGGGFSAEVMVGDGQQGPQGKLDPAVKAEVDKQIDALIQGKDLDAETIRRIRMRAYMQARQAAAQGGQVDLGKIKEIAQRAVNNPGGGSHGPNWPGHNNPPPPVNECLKHWRLGCGGSFSQDAQAGNAQQSLSALDSIIRADPNNVEALDARSNILFGMGQLQAANDDARRALELDPTDQAALALFKLTEGRADSQGGNPAGQVAQAGAELKSGAGTGGSGAPGLPTRPALPMSERNPSAENAVQAAKNALALNDMPAAVSQLDRALAADPRSVDAYRLRAMVYARQGKHDSSLRDAEAGLGLAPRDASLLLIKAFDQNRRRQYNEALAAAGTARELDPASVDAVANYAHALGGLGQREQMFDLLEQAAARDARYQASLRDARSRPVGGDILFLFPGEAGAGGSAQPVGPVGGDRPTRTRRYGMLAIATVLGGILVALGFLQTAAGPLTKRFRTSAAAAPAGSSTLTPRALGEADGELLRGQYKVLRQIGSGGMGLVFEGSDVTLNRPVAVKKMRDELRLDRRERVRFISEARTVAALHHPNIVDIYAVIEEGDELYLVFEFVSGQTVYDMITHQGALSFKEALGIARGMTAALDYAHGRGIIHRDLKPSNVMVNNEGFIKVMDFGIARMAKDAATRVSMTNTVVGTPPYMAPEQEQGVVRKEADVYSLAICVYEMLCGRAAFAGTGAGMLMNKVNMSYIPLSKEVPNLPQGIDLVFARAFQADPDRRFHTAGEFLAALEALPAPHI
ncbi:MAG: protein kinase [Elusimicrobia bacterium]|nr:protein kinase [Elusimicrobiota bacterium]